MGFQFKFVTIFAICAATFSLVSAQAADDHELVKKTSSRPRLTEAQIVDRDRKHYLSFVERENLRELSVCEDVLNAHLAARNPRKSEEFEKFWERRRILQANLPAYSWKSNIHFLYDVPGLKIKFEQTPYTGDLHNSEILDFRLDYDPSHFSRLSVIRRMFGSKPLNLSISDLRLGAEIMYLSDEGKFIQLYLRGSNQTEDYNKDNGGMLMISRDTGQIIFWPPGTDVDGDLEGIFKGSIYAMANFALGLVNETQNILQKYRGSWFTNGDILDLEPTRTLPAPRSE